MIAAEQTRRCDTFVREDLFGNLFFVGARAHQLGGELEHLGRRIRMHEAAGVGHDRRKDAGRDVAVDLRVSSREAGA